MPASPTGRPRRNSWALLSATAQDATGSWWNAQFLLVKFVKSSCLVKLPQLNCQSHPLSWVSNLWLKTWILLWKLPLQGQCCHWNRHTWQRWWVNLRWSKDTQSRCGTGTSMELPWDEQPTEVECQNVLNDIKSRLRVSPCSTPSA